MMLSIFHSKAEKNLRKVMSIIYNQKGSTIQSPNGQMYSIIEDLLPRGYETEVQTLLIRGWIVSPVHGFIGIEAKNIKSSLVPGNAATAAIQKNRNGDGYVYRITDAGYAALYDYPTTYYSTLAISGLGLCVSLLALLLGQHH